MTRSSQVSGDPEQLGWVGRLAGPRSPIFRSWRFTSAPTISPSGSVLRVDSLGLTEPLTRSGRAG